MGAVGTKVGGGAWSKGSPPGEPEQWSARTPPVSRRSGLLARLPSTHTLARTAPADEKRDSWRHVNAHGFNSESVRLNVIGLGSKILWLFICATCHKHLSQIEEKNYEGIFVPYHVTMLSFMNFWSLLEFLKFKIQDSKQYHNLHHAINFQAIHLSCCIS